MEGGVQLFGRVLAVWVFITAALFLLTGAYWGLTGVPPHTMRHG